MQRKFNELLIIGLGGTIFFGSFFAGEYLGASESNKDSWWTPMTMALSLDQTRPEFELYLKKELLQKHIEKGTLLVANDGENLSKLVLGDIKIRLNNWNKVKAEKLKYAVITAFFLGASIALLIIGLMRFLADKEDAH
ncbi:MAG TPA: hypothetical protein PLD26_06565 [Smithella sp.]|nr:hypothetical protein [Smithella sp.]